MSREQNVFAILILAMFILAPTFPLMAQDVFWASPFQAATHFYELLINYVANNPEYAYSSMSLQHGEDLREAFLGTPFEFYSLSSSRMKSFPATPDDFLSGARLSYLCYPVMINNDVHGVVQVQQDENGKWIGVGYLGYEGIFNDLHSARVANGIMNNQYTIILLDSSCLFSFTRISSGCFIKPANLHAASVFGGNMEEIPFKKAMDRLAAHLESR